MVVIVYNLIFGLAAEAIGIPPLLLGVMTAILLITSVLLLWRLYKIGT